MIMMLGRNVSVCDLQKLEFLSLSLSNLRKKYHTLNGTTSMWMPVLMRTCIAHHMLQKNHSRKIHGGSVHCTLRDNCSSRNYSHFWCLR